MIISHRKKFAFFANQKTGSKAVGLVLRLSGIFDENDIMIAQPFPATRTAAIELPAYNADVPDHITPTQAIEQGFITLEQLREYDCFAFLRDPYERFVACRAALQIDRNGVLHDPNGRGLRRVAPPQFEFFFVGDEQVVTPLDFGNYEQEIRTMMSSLGAYEQMDVPQIKEILDPRMHRKVQYDPSQHVRDNVLYKQMIANNSI